MMMNLMITVEMMKIMDIVQDKIGKRRNNCNKDRELVQGILRLEQIIVVILIIQIVFVEIIIIIISRILKIINKNNKKISEDNQKDKNKNNHNTALVKEEQKIQRIVLGSNLQKDSKHTINKTPMKMQWLNALAVTEQAIKHK